MIKSTCSKNLIVKLEMLKIQTFTWTKLKLNSLTLNSNVMKKELLTVSLETIEIDVGSIPTTS